MRVGSLCSGAGGFELGLEMVAEADLDFVADNAIGPAAVLARRFPGVPNLGDLSKIDWPGLLPPGYIDVLTMGFPCTNVSVAGDRTGLTQDNSSGVWHECARAISYLQPPVVLIENVRGLLSARADSDVEFCPWCMGTRRDKHPLRALGAVLASLADLGYDADWETVSASDVGAPHRRDRVFIVAWPSAENADGPAGRERGLAASLQEAGWRPRTDPGGRSGVSLAADTWSARLEGVPGVPGEDEERSAEGSGGHGPDGGDWGPYGPAIRHWERVLGRPAPSPTEPGRTGDRLSPYFTEWMMGLPDGWVTGAGMSRRQQMMVLGNGCIPQQAALALQLLIPAMELCGSLRVELRGAARPGQPD